jgi:hypothetical protein
MQGWSAAIALRQVRGSRIALLAERISLVEKERG